MKTQIIADPAPEKEIKRKRIDRFQLKDYLSFRVKDMNLSFKMNGLWGSKSRTEATDVISAMTLEV